MVKVFHPLFASTLFLVILVITFNTKLPCKLCGCKHSSVLLLDSFNMFKWNIPVAIAEENLDWWNLSTSIYTSFCGLVIILWKSIFSLDNICLLYWVAVVQWLADIGGRGDMQIYALLFSPPPTFITIQCYFLFWEWGWDNRKESVQKEYCKSVLTLGLANGTLGDFLAKSVIILYNRQFPLQKG